MDQSQNLIQQLRQIASRIIQTNSNPDECPLCHTQFGTDELLNHINVGIENQLDVQSRIVLSELPDFESEVQSKRADVAAVTWLRSFVEQVRLPVDMSVEGVLAEVNRERRSLADGDLRIESLANEINALDSQGLTMERLEEGVARLREIGFGPSELSIEEGID